MTWIEAQALYLDILCIIPTEVNMYMYMLANEVELAMDVL